MTRRIDPLPGQESVWDYPRPPRVEPERRHARIEFGGTVIAETDDALRVLETSHPPGIYLPRDAFAPGVLTVNRRRTSCEWKGTATYWDVNATGAVASAAAWSYEEPRPGYEAIAGFISVYPQRMDACYLGAEQVKSQEGDFYGGWITDEIIGPFKGAPGTWGW